MLSDNDVERIADAVAKRQEHSCPLGLTPDAVAMVNALASNWKTGKKIAFVTAITVVVTALIGMLAMGFKSYLK